MFLQVIDRIVMTDRDETYICSISGNSLVSTDQQPD